MRSSHRFATSVLVALCLLAFSGLVNSADVTFINGAASQSGIQGGSGAIGGSIGGGIYGSGAATFGQYESGAQSTSTLGPDGGGGLALTNTSEGYSRGGNFSVVLGGSRGQAATISGAASRGSARHLGLAGLRIRLP